MFSDMNADRNNAVHNSNSTPALQMSGPSPWINPPSNLQIESLTAQQVALNDQIRESETNLSAQHEVKIVRLLNSSVARKYRFRRWSK